MPQENNRTFSEHSKESPGQENSAPQAQGQGEQQDLPVEENAGEAPEEFVTEIYPEDENEAAASGPAEDQSKKIAELEDRLVRLMADYENFRKRMQKEKSQERQRGRRDGVEKLLPVYDSVQMGLVALKDADENVKSGFEAVRQQLLRSFQDLGIKQVATVGQQFDPEVHEAIANMPSDEYEEGMIAEESRAGFFDEIGLLRPAQVVVSSGASNQEAAPQ